MGDYLSKDRLSFISESIVRSVVAMCSEFQRFSELPFEVYRQADWNLVSGEAGYVLELHALEWVRQAYMSFVGISIWFSPRVYRPRRVTLGLVMTLCPAPNNSRSSPFWRIAQLLAGMLRLLGCE